MASWIYLFSKFTPEALLFEALFIFILVSSYASFWILRKRRWGVIETAVPASVVKTYLNELIVDAEHLRVQLFGLLSAAGAIPKAQLTSSSAGPQLIARAPSADPELQAKLAALEAKMREQSDAMETILQDKAKLEKELSEARSKDGAAAPASTANEEELFRLKDKLQQMEARLAEYSVIEDDLANLKRLQQENAQLRAALGGGKAPEPAPMPASAPPAEAELALGVAAATAPAPEKVAAAEPAPEAVAEKPAVTASGPGAGTTAAPAAVEPAIGAAPGGDVNFAGLTDKVEESLKSEEPAVDVTKVSTQAAPKPTVEKSDEDLIAEFEKMLNS